MKPTHILVPIDKFDAIDRSDPNCFFNACSLVVMSPRVDLSEEGIQEEIDKYLYSHEERVGYKQCAKDLLNTKP
jgi:hypothetical protein